MGASAGPEAERLYLPGIFLKANLFWNGERKNNQQRGDNNGKLAVGVPGSADCAVCFMSQGSYHCNRGEKTDRQTGVNASRAWPQRRCSDVEEEKPSRLQATSVHSRHFRTRMCKTGPHERPHSHTGKAEYGSHVVHFALIGDGLGFFFSKRLSALKKNNSRAQSSSSSEHCSSSGEAVGPHQGSYAYSDPAGLR